MTTASLGTSEPTPAAHCKGRALASSTTRAASDPTMGSTQCLGIDVQRLTSDPLNPEIINIDLTLLFPLLEAAVISGQCAKHLSQLGRVPDRDEDSGSSVLQKLRYS